MNNQTATMENERLMRLESSRTAENIKTLAKSKSRVAKAKAIFSFRQQISKHWLILSIAALFDLLALIPFISVFFNLCFGFILFLYFGPKKFTKTAMVILGGSVLDLLFSILPVNIAATVVRIAVKETS